jgi:urease accessory protein
VIPSALRAVPLAALASVLLALPAAAHHPMGGRTPATFMEGLLSGFGHPIIGLDHLAFILAVGIAVGVTGLHLLTPFAFAAFSALGVGLHLTGFDAPGAEFLVAATVVVAGLLLLRGRAVPSGLWLALFCVAGICHGYAFGETVVGAEAAPIRAYLLGLALTQGLIGAGVAYGLIRSRQGAASVSARASGGAIALVGLGALVLPLLG